MMKQYLEAGQIVGTHGVRGELRLHPWCDGPDFLKGIKALYLDADGKKAVAVESVRAHGNVALLRLAGIHTVEEAEALRSRVLYFDRADRPLADNQNYIEDLIGCRVMDADSRDLCYGVIADVLTGIANDVWTVRDESGRETLIPVIKQVVLQTDVQHEKVYIRPLKGLFSEECVVREEEA